MFVKAREKMRQTLYKLVQHCKGATGSWLRTTRPKYITEKTSQSTLRVMHENGN